jgi:hypothetical protein
MISPTVGRVVWFWSGHEWRALQPEAALIVFVHSDIMVNLAIFDLAGRFRNRTRVELYQGEGDRPEDAFCEWIRDERALPAKPFPKLAAAHAGPVK